MHEKKFDENGTAVYYGIVFDLLETLAEVLNFR